MPVYYDNHQGTLGFREFLGREYIKRPDALLNRAPQRKFAAFLPNQRVLAFGSERLSYGARYPIDGFPIPIGLGGFNDCLRLWHHPCQ
jgi:hypothetical protein